MTIQDLLRAWEQAVDDATIEQKRADETDEMLDTRTGLSAGYCLGNSYHGNRSAFC